MTRKETTMQIYEELIARGILAQASDEAEIRELLNGGKATFYIGFDPTADSLHVGHFVPLSLMRRLQLAGNRPIALIGGGTGMIGDPSDRSDLRKVLDVDMIDHYCECMKGQMAKFLDFGEGKAIMVNNADWLRELKYVDLLREVAAHFSVNRMLAAECYKQRLEKGLSFLEFNYMIMQSYDFYVLFQKYGCQMQLGGDDQWSNLLAGADLIRRKLGKNAYAMTNKLLVNADGSKMGKTAGGAVWLSAERTSPFDFYQYWRNVADADVLSYIKWLTFLPLAEIQAMEQWEGSQLNEAKNILAREMTTLIHGEDEAKKAEAGAQKLFAAHRAGDIHTVAGADIPTTTLKTEDFCEGQTDIVSLLVKGGLVSSRSEGRRAVEQGGVSVNGEKIGDFKRAFPKEQFVGEGLLIRRGKKHFCKYAWAED